MCIIYKTKYAIHKMKLLTVLLLMHGAQTNFNVHIMCATLPYKEQMCKKLYEYKSNLIHLRMRQVWHVWDKYNTSITYMKEVWQVWDKYETSMRQIWDK